MSNINNLLLITGLVMFWLIPLLAWAMFDEKGQLTAKFWLAGMLTYAIVVTFFVVGAYLPSWCANLGMTFSTATLLLFGEAIRLEYQNSKTDWTLNAAIVLAQYCLTMFLWSQNLHADVNIPVFLIFTVCLECALIYRMRIVYKMYRSKAMLVLIGFFSFVILANLARVINQQLGNSSGQLTDNSAVSNTAFVIYLVSVIFYSFGYGIFVSEKTKFKLGKALEGERIATEHEQSAVALLKERDILIKKLTRLQKSVQTSALSSTIAHEINQPLSVIKLEAQYALLQLDNVSPNALKGLLEQIISNTNRSAQIVRTIRVIFDDSDHEVEIRPIHEVIKSTCSLLAPHAKNEGIGINQQTDCSIPVPIRGAELEHVLINLINNAIDSLILSNQPSKLITVTTKADDNKIIISVADNGVGINPEHANHLFDLMQTDKVKGSGIGLWLCRFIVERWGGKIELLEPSKKGATFTIEIPRYDAVSKSPR